MIRDRFFFAKDSLTDSKITHPGSAECPAWSPQAFPGAHLCLNVTLGCLNLFQT